MAREWHELTSLTKGATFTVERIKLQDSETAVEGSFELPRLATLATEDQVFVMAFVQSHGSIKEMERAFGVSYPTVKNRLNRICDQLQLVEIETVPPGGEVLDSLDRGEISAQEAIERLST